MKQKWFLLIFALLLIAGIAVTSVAISKGIKQEHQTLCINPLMHNVKGVSLNLNDAVSAKDDETFRQAMSGAMTYFNTLSNSHHTSLESIYWAYPEDLELLHRSITNAHASYSALYDKRPLRSELSEEDKALLTRYAAAFDELLHALVRDDDLYDPMVLDPKVFDPDALSEMIHTFSDRLRTMTN